MYNSYSIVEDDKGSSTINIIETISDKILEAIALIKTGKTKEEREQTSTSTAVQPTSKPEPFWEKDWFPLAIAGIIIYKLIK